MNKIKLGNNVVWGFDNSDVEFVYILTYAIFLERLFY